MKWEVMVERGVGDESSKKKSLILFRVFAKGASFVRAEESAESETGGAVFMNNIC